MTKSFVSPAFIPVLRRRRRVQAGLVRRRPLLTRPPLPGHGRPLGLQPPERPRGAGPQQGTEVAAGEEVLDTLHQEEGGGRRAEGMLVFFKKNIEKKFF